MSFSLTFLLTKCANRPHQCLLLKEGLSLPRDSTSSWWPRGRQGLVELAPPLFVEGHLGFLLDLCPLPDSGATQAQWLHTQQHCSLCQWTVQSDTPPAGSPASGKCPVGQAAVCFSGWKFPMREKGQHSEPGSLVRLKERKLGERVAKWGKVFYKQLNYAWLLILSSGFATHMIPLAAVETDEIALMCLGFRI